MDNGTKPDTTAAPVVTGFRIEIFLDNAGQLKVEAHGCADGWACASVLLAAVNAVLAQIKASGEQPKRILQFPPGVVFPPMKNRGS